MIRTLLSVGAVILGLCAVGRAESAAVTVETRRADQAARPDRPRGDRGRPGPVLPESSRSRVRRDRAAGDAGHLPASRAAPV